MLRERERERGSDRENKSYHKVIIIIIIIIMTGITRNRNWMKKIQKKKFQKSSTNSIFDAIPVRAVETRQCDDDSSLLCNSL